MLEESCVVHKNSEDNTNLSKETMATPQNVIFRLSIVLGMVAAVVTIIYLSPLPDHSFLSCDRPCHALDWPMICRMKVYIENPDEKTNCENCTYNFTNYCKKEICSLAEDPKTRKILINGQITGPSIQVCQNDILVVDVINKIPGQSLTVHWRGQPNNEAPFMDGVPLVTQCPILSYTTFQYKFRASSAGTHYYHAYSDHDRSQGLFGALIVRQPDNINPHRKLYEIDSKDHVILLSEWSEEKSLLINGKASTSSPFVFNVAEGKRYRFRLAYTAGELSCPVTLSIDNHLVKIISVDGNPIKPHEVSSLSLNKGERVDFVLKTNQKAREYFLRVKSDCGYEGMAVVNYEGSKKNAENSTIISRKLDKIIARGFDTRSCESSIGKVCLDHVQAVQKLPEELKREIVDKVLYLTIGSRIVADDNQQTSHRVYGINNLTFLYPSSPLLTQLSEIPISTVCDEENIPEKCSGEEVCECIHVEYIPLGSGTEIILINQDNEEHIFHLHGHRFWVIASKQFQGTPVANEIRMLDEERKLLKRNLNSPVAKDTIRIEKNSVVVLRFIADNAGFWMLRDENSKGWTRGMDIVFQIGDTIDMVSMPTNFPTCGNFIGPDFFLT